MKKKIAVIGLKGLPAFGGAAAVGENIINQLQDKYEFTVYSVSSHTDQQTGLPNGYRQIVFKSINNKKLNTLYYYIKSALHAFFRGHYDLIHLHHSAAVFTLLLLRLKYRVIVTTHGVHNLGKLPKWSRFNIFFKFQTKYFLKLANKISCVSKVEKDWLLENIGIEASFIPNGISVKTPSIGTDEKYSIFFGAGRIIESKGCDILLNALNNLKFTQHIAIAGDLNQSNKYKNYITKLSSTLNVNFLGLIRNKEILLNHIKSAKLFVYPSEKEAMSMMLLEAASVQTPIICSDIRENRDIFSDNEVLFFSLEKEFDLDNKIVWAFDNYNIMRDNAKNAFEKIKINNNWNLIKDEYNSLYISLLN